MANKLEERIQSIERSMVTVVKTLREMRVNINELQENRIKQHDDESEKSLRIKS